MLEEKFLCESERKGGNYEEIFSRYYETYSKSYEIEANSKEEAEDILKYEIQEGKLDGPECCDNSWCEVTEME